MSTATIAISTVRMALAAVLAPVGPNDPPVVPFDPDAAIAPSLGIRWDDPWLEPAGQCRYNALLQIIAVTSLLEPAAAIADLESMVALVIDRLDADPYPWWVTRVGAPGRFPSGGIEYQGCIAQIRVPVSPA